MNVYICSAKRTPIGSYGKTLKGVTAKTLGVTAAKAAINKAAIETIAAGKAQETTEFTLLFDTHDQKEGMAAMIEKRPAVFTNN